MGIAVGSALGEEGERQHFFGFGYFHPKKAKVVESWRVFFWSRVGGRLWLKGLAKLASGKREKRER